jgi:5-methylcytosine-specific restriction enzyme A
MPDYPLGANLMAPHTGFGRDVRQLVMARSGGLCDRCGNYHTRTELHHRRPRKMGGTQRPETNTASAALLLCAPCHAVTESNRTEAYEYGWLVHDYAGSPPPSRVPVVRRGRWVYLGDDGSVNDHRSGGWGETPSLGEDWPIGEVSF